jgi:hypothetical protein
MPGHVQSLAVAVTGASGGIAAMLSAILASYSLMKAAVSGGLTTALVVAFASPAVGAAGESGSTKNPKEAPMVSTHPPPAPKLFLHITCRRESKPGAERYELAIDDGKWRVAMWRGGSTTERAGDGVRLEESAALERIYQRARAQDWHDVREGKIGGRCDVELGHPLPATVPPLALSAPFLNQQLRNLAPLWAWVRAFHRARPALAEIEPLVPGDES